MTVTGVDSLQSPLALASSVQPRKNVAALTPKTVSDQATDQSAAGSPSAIQDQVTLSREAQALSVTDSQPSKNNTFQQSPSPFDK